MIKVRYSSIDGFNQTRSFKTIEGARKFASRYVGETPDTSSFGQYAISDDGVGKITVEGASLRDLFSSSHPADERLLDEQLLDEQKIYEALNADDAARHAAAHYYDHRDPGPHRTPRCTCSDQQLNLVGCDCGAEDPLPF